MSGPQGNSAPYSTADDTSKPYHSKRPHKKSRAGCINCKTRKVKCSEERPACRNCVLRNVNCVYPPPKVTATASSSTSSRAPISRGSSSTYYTSSNFNSPGTSIPPLEPVNVVSEPLYIPHGVHDAVDMKLLWFYSTTTFYSFMTSASKQPRVDDILKVTIPRHAFQNSFLMDTVLALTAMHLQHLGPTDSAITAQAVGVHPSRVFHYRARAFEGYRKAIEAADPRSFPALMAGSLLLVGVASQMFRESEPGCEQPPRSYLQKHGDQLRILDWMVVWRGIGLMIEFIRPSRLRESGVAELFFRPPINLNRSVGHIPNHLLFAISSIGSSTRSDPDSLGSKADNDDDDDDDPSDLPTYYEALKYLGSLYGELNVGGLTPIMSLRILTWFTFLPEPFIALATARRPRALLIMAHYAMFTKLLEYHIWWASNIADREIPALIRHLTAGGPRWDAHLTTPARIIGINDPLEASRIILDDPEWTSATGPDSLGTVANAAFLRDPVDSDNEGSSAGGSSPDSEIGLRSCAAGDDAPPSGVINSLRSVKLVDQRGRRMRYDEASLSFVYVDNVDNDGGDGGVPIGGGNGQGSHHEARAGPGSTAARGAKPTAISSPWSSGLAVYVDKALQANPYFGEYLGGDADLRDGAPASGDGDVGPLDIGLDGIHMKLPRG